MKILSILIAFIVVFFVVLVQSKWMIEVFDIDTVQKEIEVL